MLYVSSNYENEFWQDCYQINNDLFRHTGQKYRSYQIESDNRKLEIIEEFWKWSKHGPNCRKVWIGGWRKHSYQRYINRFSWVKIYIHLDEPVYGRLYEWCEFSPISFGIIFPKLVLLAAKFSNKLSQLWNFHRFLSDGRW